MNLDYRHYQKLYDSSNDLILILDGNNGKIIDANPAILKILNFKNQK
jgi:PAS domain-containing protein